MAVESKIEWTDATFNPWIGCTKISPACDHCYASVSTATRRFGVEWGAGKPRRRTSPDNWALPERWNRQHEEFFAEHGRRRRVFCASLADVFDNEVHASWRWDLFRLIRATPNLDWLLLTKRIGNARDMLNTAAAAALEDFVGAKTWDRDPWSNVWLGATIANQQEAERDIPKLLSVPASRWFLSMEPLLGPVDLRTVMVPNSITRDMVPALRRLHWVIVGGESGISARPMHPDWAYSLRDQCEDFGVPFLFKQWGNWAAPGNPAFGNHRGRIAHINSAGEFWLPAPEDEDADCLTVVNVGKHAAGRLLGGREHNGYPEPRIR